ncbi:MAG TPA: hypothetical protein VFQ53_31010 [Kofleriaceae bacterium]|nr:hypothetical protein [Kofleriaceae bacterium]
MSRLIVSVVDDGDCPIAGAEVYVEPQASILTTQLDGTVGLELLSERTYEIWARHNNYYAWPVLVDVKDERHHIILRLQLGATLAVHVFSHRRPVPHATLSLGFGITALTDAHGYTEVAGLAPMQYIGWVRADGLADEPISVLLHQDPGAFIERYINMHEGTRVSGVVLDERGTPAPGVAVWLSSNSSTAYYNVVCDNFGGWSVVARDGYYEVVAYDNHRASEPLTFHCDEASRTGITISLVQKQQQGTPPSARIAGVVVDESGDHVPQAHIRIGSRQTRSDANGRFQMLGLMDGEYDAAADWDGPWLPLRSNIALQRVHAGDVNARLVVRKGAEITGRVLYDGKPLSYFGLRVVSRQESPYGGIPIGVRSDQGVFVLRHVHPGTWRLAIMAPSTMLVTSQEFTLTGMETIDIGDVVLKRAQSLAGYVRDKSGIPVQEARVMVGRFFAEQRSPLERLFMSQYETKSNREGYYEFKGVDANGWLEDVPEGNRPMLNDSLTELVWAAHPVHGLSVVNELPSTGKMDLVLLGSGRLEGVIENAGDLLLSVIATRVGEPPCPRQTTCLRGNFVFEAVPPGEYIVSLQSSDGPKHASVRVHADRTSVVTFSLST